MSDPTSPHDRSRNSSSFARAMFWGSRASSVALQFVIPPGIGVWADYSLDIAPFGVVLGAVLGFVIGLRQLLRLVKQMDTSE